MDKFNYKNYSIFYNFLNRLAKDLTKLYHQKLCKNFKVSNKVKGKGYDPVTTSDKAFEKFIRLKINEKFQITKLLEKNLVSKNQKVITLGL